jgi:hypothetical protein
LTVLPLDAWAGSDAVAEDSEPEELASLADPLDSPEPEELAPEALDELAPEELVPVALRAPALAALALAFLTDAVLAAVEECGPVAPVEARLAAALSAGSCPDASCT